MIARRGVTTSAVKGETVMRILSKAVYAVKFLFFLVIGYLTGGASVHIFDRDEEERKN